VKTKTIKGTNVEVIGTSGCNLVIVKVGGRDEFAQADATDLLRPAEVPPELSELSFYDPDKAPKVAETAEPVEGEKPAEDIA
jgi:hypothetical protein